LTDSRFPTPDSRDSFSFPIRVYWEDTDGGGVVYHASYLRFLERARTEWLRTLGIGQRELRERDDVVFAIRSVTMEFLAPARLDDEIDATVRLSELGRASLGFAQTLRRCGDGVLLVEAQVRAACLTASTFRPRALPAGLFDNKKNPAWSGDE
jgi:acyl-CoA thioester hydrolase